MAASSTGRRGELVAARAANWAGIAGDDGGIEVVAL